MEMFWMELAVLVIAIAIGARWGGLGLGAARWRYRSGHYGLWLWPQARCSSDQRLDDHDRSGGLLLCVARLRWFGLLSQYRKQITS